MRYGRKQRRTQKKERPYARRLKYESAKEALGKVVEWGSAGVGMLVGLAGAKYGLPVSPGVASTGGAIIGGLLGAQGKAVVVASLDHARERREKRQTAAASESRSATRGGTSGAGGTRSGSTPSARVAPLPRSRSGSASIAGQVIGGLDSVIEQVNRASRQLAEIHRSMWAAQNALNAVLAGGRPDIILTLESRLTAARGHVHDSTGELTAAADHLGTYRAAI